MKDSIKFCSECAFTALNRSILMALIFFAVSSAEIFSLEYRRSDLIRDLNHLDGSKFFNKDDDSEEVEIDGESFHRKKFGAVVEAYLNCAAAIKPIEESLANRPDGNGKLPQHQQERFTQHCFSLIDPDNFTLRSGYLNPSILSYWNSNLFNDLKLRSQYREIILSMKREIQMQEQKEKELELQRQAEREQATKVNKDKLAAIEKRRKKEQDKADREEVAVKARAKQIADKTMEKEKAVLFGSARICRPDRKISILSMEYDRALPCFSMRERRISDTKIHVFQVLYECTLPGSEKKFRPEVAIPFTLTTTGLSTFRPDLQNATPSPFCN